MNRLKSKSEERYFNRLSKNIVLRQTKYFRRNLHVNHEETFVKILRIKNDEDFDNEILGYKELPRDVCFYFYHLSPFTLDQKLFSINDSEYIITNNKTNKVIAINEQIKNYSEFVNVWVVKKNVVDFLRINVGDIVFTR